MRGVIVAAVLIIALMLVIRDGRALRRIGFVGSCTSVTAPAGETGAWEKCTSGKLQGAPDLSRQGCTSASMVGKIEYWRCPAGIQSQQGS